MIREEIIERIVAGKSVLDIGSIGQSNEYLLWEMLEKASAKIVGVDLPDAQSVANDEFDVKVEHGNNSSIVYGNMETIDLNEKFDVVVAGDVIEHVDNPGLFLSNIKKHLHEHGRMVITTPNAKWPTVFLKPNPTHVLWHDIYTLRALLERVGFSISSWRYYPGNKRHYSPLKRVLAWRQSLLLVCEIEA